MKITKIKVLKDGSRMIAAHVTKDETLFAIDRTMHYRLGGQVDALVWNKCGIRAAIDAELERK